MEGTLLRSLALERENTELRRRLRKVDARSELMEEEESDLFRGSREALKALRTLEAQTAGDAGGADSEFGALAR